MTHAATPKADANPDSKRDGAIGEDWAKWSETAARNRVAALAEADARRLAERKALAPQEINGRDGPEPTRYGDWERNGLISDF